MTEVAHIDASGELIQLLSHEEFHTVSVKLVSKWTTLNYAWISFIALLLIWTGYSLYRYRKLSPRRPNVLIISLDTLRADHLSCYGYAGETSPNIDKLAMQGHRFLNAYTTMPTTLPAHASLFTSLQPVQLSVRRNGEIVPDEVVTLAEVLLEKGYSTAAFVSAAVMNAYYRINQGFVLYDHGRPDRLSRTASETIDRAKIWLSQHRKEPFLLFVHLYDPHTPYYAPEEYRNRWGAPDQPVPDEFEFVRFPDRFTDDVIRKTIAAYDAEIAYADWAVGELMRELGQHGLGERTHVVIVSDHGESLDELKSRYGYLFDHGEFLYAYELRIPLIIRLAKNFSDLSGPAEHATPVGIVDVMPTLLELLDIDPPDRMVGHSLMPMLRRETMQRGPVFSERRFAEANASRPFLAQEELSIVDGDRHLIYSRGRGNELYDLRGDPQETSNLIDQDPASAALLDALHRQVGELKPLFGPPMLGTDPAAIKKLQSLGYLNDTEEP